VARDSQHGSEAVTSRIRPLLFPEPPREFPCRRALKIALRGAHVVCASFCLGAYAFDASQRVPWLVATVATGLMVLALDLHESAAFLLQARGVVVVAKLAALSFLPEGGAWLLAGVAFVSVVSSHAPSRVRHRVLFARGRVRAAETHG
jgi:hypothetical protein